MVEKAEKNINRKKSPPIGGGDLKKQQAIIIKRAINTKDKKGVFKKVLLVGSYF